MVLYRVFFAAVYIETYIVVNHNLNNLTATLNNELNHIANDLRQVSFKVLMERVTSARLLGVILDNVEWKSHTIIIPG